MVRYLVRGASVVGSIFRTCGTYSTPFLNWNPNRKHLTSSCRHTFWAAYPYFGRQNRPFYSTKKQTKILLGALHHLANLQTNEIHQLPIMPPTRTLASLAPLARAPFRQINTRLPPVTYQVQQCRNLRNDFTDHSDLGGPGGSEPPSPVPNKHNWY